MKKQTILLIVILLVFFLFIMIEPSFAGPGGAIAKGFFRTWWGKLILIALVIILLPVILYVQVVEFLGIRKAKKELLKLGMINKDFMWLHLRNNVENVFTRTYVAWSNENMEEVSSLVNHWYWQNQQLVYLDKWKQENRKNVCSCYSVINIAPLYLEISDDENLDYSKIAFAIKANVEDYLVDRNTNQVVYGKKGFHEETKIWIMQYSGGRWLLDNILDDSFTMQFAKMENVLPDLSNRAAARKAVKTD